MGRVTNLCEMFCGPGYIGFSLLANGFCEHLTLVDVNPAAVAMVNRTIALNGLEKTVTVHESDLMEDLPSSERWDLVVANPPHFLPQARHDSKNIKAFDPDWSLHRRFYATVAKHMKSGGHIVVEESALPHIESRRTRKRLLKSPPIFERHGGAWRINLDSVSHVLPETYAQGSTPELFVPMISEGGGTYVGWYPTINVVGKHDGMFYVVSKWP